MIRAMLSTGENDYVLGGEELLAQWRAIPNTRIWLDIEGDPSEDTRRLLESMHCDGLAINDCFRTRVLAN